MNKNKKKKWVECLNEFSKILTSIIMITCGFLGFLGAFGLAFSAVFVKNYLLLAMAYGTYVCSINTVILYSYIYVKRVKAMEEK